MSNDYEFQTEELEVSAPPAPAAPKEVVAPAPVKPAPKAQAKKDEAKTPANESAVAARAAAVIRSLGSNEGQEKTKAEPAPSAVGRGQTIASKFLARAAQRNG